MRRSGVRRRTENGGLASGRHTARTHSRMRHRPDQRLAQRRQQAGEGYRSPAGRKAKGLNSGVPKTNPVCLYASRLPREQRFAGRNQITPRSGWGSKACQNHGPGIEANHAWAMPIQLWPKGPVQSILFGLGAREKLMKVIGEQGNSQSRTSIIVSLAVRTAIFGVIIIGAWYEHPGRVPGWFLWPIRLAFPCAVAWGWYRSLPELRARVQSPTGDASAEPGAPPNGGPSERFGNSGVGGGPPSVS